MEPAHSWQNDFAISFVHVLVTLHDCEPVSLPIVGDAARGNLLIPIICISLEDYNSSYPIIVRIHPMSYVESTLEEILRTESPKNRGD